MKDYCYRKVKKQYKVFPSAYASGAIVQCRRRLGKNSRFSLEKKYGLHGWFMRGGGKGWVDCKTGKPCGRKKGEKRKYPACRPTLAMCNSAMKKKRGRKRISWIRDNGRMKDSEKAEIIARWAYQQAKYFIERNMNPQFPGSYPAGIDQANEYMDVKFHISSKLKKMAKGNYWSFRRDELLAKYPTIRNNPIPPKSVSRVACRGLAKRRKYKRGGTAVGVARARDLCNRKNVSMRTIKRTFSYFSRHRASRAENRRRIADPVSPARIADELWGGTPGYRWVKKVLG